MLDAIRRFLGDKATVSGSTEPGGGPLDARIAACAILIELANVDGQFSEVERSRIREILQRQFGVDEAGADSLMAEAAKASRSSVDDFTFTRQVVREYDLAERIVLAELMWQVVLADGTLHGQESYLMRKLAGLLQLEPAVLSEARQRIEDQQRNTKPL